MLIVQAKFRETLNQKSESRNDVIGLLEVARLVAEEDTDKFESYLDKLQPMVAARLPEARRRFLDQGFRVLLYCVTLGKVSDTIRNDALLGISGFGGPVTMEIIDGTSAAVVMRSYLDGVAPSIPACTLETEQGDGVLANDMAKRYDQKNGIGCWVLSMRGDKLAELFQVARTRLFARNVRGYLGERRPVNEAMEETLQDEPDRAPRWSPLTSKWDASSKRSPSR